MLTHFSTFLNAKNLEAVHNTLSLQLYLLNTFIQQYKNHVTVVYDALFKSLQQMKYCILSDMNTKALHFREGVNIENK